MNDFIRYRSIGASFYGIKQNCIDDLIDMTYCTWTQTQLEYDLMNRSLPVGLLLMDITNGEVFKITCQRTPHGHKHIVESITKEMMDGTELVQEGI
jgi:hypothetical protein